MIAARQELDLRPQLERLDRLICWSEGIDEGALTFAFRPLWQMDEPSKAALALTKAQATQIYAGLGLWPAEVMAQLVEAQLVADGTYPNATAVFAGNATAEVGDAPMVDAPWAGAGALHYLTEPRNRIGEWAEGEDGPDGPLTLASFHREEERRRRRAKRLKKQARKRDREERRRQEAAEQHGGSSNRERSDPEPEAKPSGPPEVNPEKEGSESRPVPHDLLPDSDRDEFELPAGVTPQEAKELHLNGSPVGISFEVQGNSTTAPGDSYSDAVNVFRGAQKAPPVRKFGSSEPDGILASREPSQKIGVEAKFVEDWSESIYNPDLRRVFLHGKVQKTIDQALKYAAECPAGVEWYTNSLDFVRSYSRKFREAGVANFTFTIIPSGLPSFYEITTSLWIASDRCITSAKRSMRGRRRTSGMLGMLS